MEHVGGKEQLAAWNMLEARNSKLHGTCWRQETTSCMEHVGGKEKLAAWNMLAARNS
jgi:hypothetical protein